MLKSMKNMIVTNMLCGASIVLIYASGAVAESGILSINGNFFVDTQLVIRGSGFGTHGDYGGGSDFLNYIFEDCEKGVITKSPKWNGGFAQIDNLENRNGSNFNLTHERRAASKSYINAFGEIQNVSYRYGVKTDVKDIAPVHRYFFSTWIFFSENVGLLQAYKDGSGGKILMNTPFDSADYKDYSSFGASTDLGTLHFSTNTENGDPSIKAGALSSLMPYGTWHRIDSYVSIPDASTGYYDEVTWWVDGKLIRTTQQSGGSLQPIKENVHKVGLISFMGYMYNGGDIPFYVRTDDMYLDFTQARVEVSEHSTWDPTIQVHQEIQVPLSWSDNEITIRVNKGSFVEGANLYIYVVGENGQVVNNKGFLLTGSTPIEKPSSVQGFVPLI